MFTTVCDFNSKLFRIEITESINIAQNLDTFIRLYFMFYLKNDRHLKLLYGITVLIKKGTIIPVMYRILVSR